MWSTQTTTIADQLAERRGNLLLGGGRARGATRPGEIGWCFDVVPRG